MALNWNPKHWTPKRRRRALIIAVVALLAYPVLGTLALWTGFVEWVIRSEDVRVDFANPSYTIWPGRVHLKHVKIYVNGDTQFILEGSDLLTDFSLFAFFKHHIHVTDLSAHDVRYQMRVQVKDQRGMKERLAAYPRLEGLPGVNVSARPPAPRPSHANKTGPYKSRASTSTSSSFGSSSTATWARVNCMAASWSVRT